MADKKILIEGSGKHCHVSQATLYKLFGDGFEMVNKKELSQPGQYATPHKITVVGPKRSTDVTILGPCRSADQIELSQTDATAIGLRPPIRESGDLAGSPGCKLIGPEGEVEINEGVIIAKRHIHFTVEDAAALGVKDKQIVKVKVGGDRALIFDEVVARVNPEYATAMHLDYDEYNAAALSGSNSTGELIV